MRKLIIVLTLILAVMVTAFPFPACATMITISSSLSGLNEAPSVASPGIGSAIVTFDDVADTLRVQINFSGLIGNTAAAHIHGPIGPTGTGPVITTTPSFTGFPIGVTSGAYDHTFDLTLASSYNPTFITGTVADAEADFFALFAGGETYLNIHTSFSPSGEIRGNLVPESVPSPVPEPSTFVLLGAGLAGLAAMGVRRRKHN